MAGKYPIPEYENIPEIGELIRQVLDDKNMTYEELAEKLQVTVEEVKAYDNFKSAPSVEILKKMSGILGIRYRALRICAGYNTVKWYPDFYLPDGTEIKLEGILDEVYYRDPSKLPQLIEELFGK